MTRPRQFSLKFTVTVVSEVGLVPDGAEITFFLGRPEDRTYVDGEFCLRWALAPGAPPLTVVAAATGPEEPEVDLEQHPGVELLTRAQVEQIGRALPPPPSRKERAGKLVPKRVPFASRPAHPAAAKTLVTERVGPADAQKQAREREIHRLVCDALRGRPERPKVCDQP